MTSPGEPTNGKVLIGSTGLQPAWNIPTGTGGITITTGAGTLNFNGSTVASSFYGDGSDGSVTFDGSTTILGMVPVANVYTMVRDIYLASSTINNGVTVITKNFRFLCNGTLTNNGTIHTNGNDGTLAGSGGAAGSVGTLQSSALGNGTAGGDGDINDGGNSNAATSPAEGGQGGNGGAGGTGAAGTAGSVAGPSATQGSPHWVIGLIIALWKAGSGGGGGGGDTVFSGGGGGAGGGCLAVFAMLFAGTGNLQAKGGNGGNGDQTIAANTGGGGGGGGGYAFILSRSVSAGSIPGQTVSVAGGTHGLGHGTGANGSDGAAGNSFLQNF